MVGGEHPVPEEEEELVGGVGEEVVGGGTVVEEDHYRQGGGREGTRPWGECWLADHDIRPTAEVAVYGGNDPRLRRGLPAASFITTSRRNSNYNRETAHSLMVF